MNIHEQVMLARQIATTAHHGQYRNDGTTPYITHPEHVAHVMERSLAVPIIVAAAWLHDVVEDTHITLNDLRAFGMNEAVVFLVDTLTYNKKAQTYLDHILRIMKVPAATTIKLADIAHNAQSSSGNLLAKYQLASYILNHPRAL